MSYDRDRAWREQEATEAMIRMRDGPQRIEMLPNGEIRAVSDWQLIETAPKGRKVIAGYANTLGNWRSVMACYYLPKTLDWNCDFDGGDEDGFAPEGWYEEIENSETIFPMSAPTHWMPLPKPPRE